MVFPYLRGHIISVLRNEMKPRDLRLTPDELFVTEKVQDFIEWSLLHSWVRDWLKYCHWYSSLALSPDVRIEDFFDAPIVTSHWNIRRTDPQLVRFGLMWKIYDMVALKGVDFKVPILEPLRAQAWILGGV